MKELAESPWTLVPLQLVVTALGCILLLMVVASVAREVSAWRAWRCGGLTAVVATGMGPNGSSRTDSVAGTRCPVQLVACGPVHPGDTSCYRYAAGALYS